MRKLVHTVVDVEILNTKTANEYTFPRLETGDVVEVAFYPFSTPTSNVNIKLETANGEEIHPSVTYLNFVPATGGGLDNSFKKVNFKGGQNIEIKLTSKDALTADFKGQFIFYIEREN